MTTASRVSDSREAFEKWAKASPEIGDKSFRRDILTEEYCSMYVYGAWLGWKAALACQGLVVSVADLEALQRYDTFAQCCNDGGGYVEIDANKDGDWIKREDLTALIAKANGHE